MAIFYVAQTRLGQLVTIQSQGDWSDHTADMEEELPKYKIQIRLIQGYNLGRIVKGPARTITSSFPATKPLFYSTQKCTNFGVIEATYTWKDWRCYHYMSLHSFPNLKDFALCSSLNCFLHSDHVLIQNQAGQHPIRLDRSGVVVSVKHYQYFSIT